MIIVESEEASLGISATSIHSILHEHLAVKKICFRWLPHNLTNAQKRLVLIGLRLRSAIYGAAQKLHCKRNINTAWDMSTWLIMHKDLTTFKD